MNISTVAFIGFSVGDGSPSATASAHSASRVHAFMWFRDDGFGWTQAGTREPGGLLSGAAGRGGIGERPWSYRGGRERDDHHPSRFRQARGQPGCAGTDGSWVDLRAVGHHDRDERADPRQRRSRRPPAGASPVIFVAPFHAPGQGRTAVTWPVCVSLAGARSSAAHRGSGGTAWPRRRPYGR